MIENYMNNKTPTILVVFGVSGDLAKRYLLPAIGQIAQLGMLPAQFHIVGVTRQLNIDISSLLKKTSNIRYIEDHISLYQMDVTNIDNYKKLDKFLEKIEHNFNAPAQRLFYLSLPAQASRSVIGLLGESLLSKRERTKLLLEKPFGINLKSAKDLIKHINKYFLPSQVYRVDHYMAKEIAQNIIVFRNGNSLFKKTWNKNFIESIKIIASEEIGIEGRSNFYEQTGALRDIIQSHLLQLLALVLMDLPKKDNLNEVSKLRLNALKHLSIPSIDKYVKRGQYEGYIDEVKNASSSVETFVSITLKSNDKKWVGVPITLITGKALKNKFTEIRVLYKKEKDNEANELFLRLQPEEGIQFNMWAKHPGYEYQISPHYLGFKFREHYNILPNAYEQVLFNAINSDHNLFISSDEIVETWRILDIVQKTWEKSNDNLIIYKRGSTIDEILNEK
jgi:glucose-6-phosphate 1-dehydrogenase